MRKFRVRFAPSPTGPLHIGGVRTALYNYLLAKKITGQIILRIEDTDQNRYVPEAEDYIMESLRWCGIEFDESPEKGGPYGPYRQSERKHLYTEYTHRLVEFGHAYYAFDTQQEIEEMRQEAARNGNHVPKYDHNIRGKMRNSLTLSRDEVESLLQQDTPYTIRLKVDPGQSVTFHDEIRGDVTFSTDELDDKILMKADGMPTYHLANIVDDHLMKISHVIRGEEWLSSTAHHVLLYRAFGWEDEMPQFAHLPLILKPTGNGKLSKRDGQKFGFPVFPMAWKTSEESFPGFREVGFDPDALINFLAFLGWNPGTEQELFTKAELINTFTVSHVVKSGARFDYDKAKWFNQQHIMAKNPEQIAEILGRFFADNKIPLSGDNLIKYIELLQPRVETYNDFYEVGKFIFEPITSFDEKTIRKKWNKDIQPHFEKINDLLSKIDNWQSEELHDAVNGYIKENELKFGAILPILRIAISGVAQGPDLYPVMELIGKDQVVSRMKAAVDIFDAQTGA